MKILQLAGVLVLSLAVTACGSNDSETGSGKSISSATTPDISSSSSVKNTSDESASVTDREKIAMHMADLMPHAEGIQSATEEVAYTSLDLSEGKISQSDALSLFEAANELYALTAMELKKITVPDIKDSELKKLTEDIHSLLVKSAEEGGLATSKMGRSVETGDSNNLDEAIGHMENLSDYAELLKPKVDLLASKIL